VTADAGQMFDLQHPLGGYAPPCVNRSPRNPNRRRERLDAANGVSGAVYDLFGDHAQCISPIDTSRQPTIDQRGEQGSDHSRVLTPRLIKRARPQPLSADELTGIARRLESERLRLGVSQSDLSRAVGVERQAVSHWFRGRAAPSAAQLVALGRAGMSIDYVLVGSPNPSAAALAAKISTLQPEQIKALLALFSR
jgi:DNA-binding transcriptional regulator YiaG